MSAPVERAAADDAGARWLSPLGTVVLAVLATGLAAAPWLRAFPSATAVVPLFGAAAVSVLLSLAMARLLRALLLAVAVDVLAFALYSLVIVLKRPLGFSDLIEGLHHGPAQLLTFALPLVSPPTLLVTPVALCWLAGALAGSALARRPDTMLPYAGWFVAFGLSYAATERALDPSGSRVIDAVLAGGLLATLALLRVVQVLARDGRGSSGGGRGVRPLLAGLATVTVVTVAAGVLAQGETFGGTPVAPERIPAVSQATPLTPLAFVAGLRPAAGSPDNPKLFTVSTSAPSSGYFTLANVDVYDGDSWSFTRTFRPSGGVVPADPAAGSTSTGAPISQRYVVTGTALNQAPWMPYLARPVTVAGVGINVDSGSGMVVPTAPMSIGTGYEVTSRAAVQTLTTLPASAQIATATAPEQTQIPVTVRPTLAKVVESFALETGEPTSSPTRFLRALAVDLQQHYGLSGGPAGSPAGSSTGSSAGSSAEASAGPSVGPVSSASTEPHTGGTNFSDVVASIIGPQRAGSPEQFATLYALVARQLGVPARVVTGFRVPSPTGTGTALPAGTYSVGAALAATWVEIPVRGAGWVAVDAVPTTYLGEQQSSVGAASSSAAPTSAAPSQSALLDTDNGGNAVAAKSSVPRSPGSSRIPLLLVVVCVLIAFVVLVILGLLVRKRRRRNRRWRQADPRGRVIGAWSEGLDVLAESGMPEIAHLTGSEIASATELRYGPESGAHVATLARTANVALYSRQSEISEREADEAWLAQQSLARSVRSQLGVVRRVAAALRHSGATERAGTEDPTALNGRALNRRVFKIRRH